MEQDGKNDEEKGFIEKTPRPKPRGTKGLSYKFWISATINIISTTGLVFVNKIIFETEALRHAQVAFAAFHFTVTAGLLYLLSHPRLNVFQAKRVKLVQILPLALAMILNVVVQNLALANSSIQFHQVIRALLTPCVALLNYILTRATLSSRRILTLFPICTGVAIVSYYDTAQKADKGKGTAPIGAIYAFSGIMISSVYTVLIGRCHKTLDCSSHQLLLNQAPVSVLLMLFVIPFSDKIAPWATTPMQTWFSLLLSGILACVLHLSTFIMIDEGGTVTGTIVGHVKLCCGILLGCLYSGKLLRYESTLGLLLVIGGIVSYGIVTQIQS